MSLEGIKRNLGLLSFSFLLQIRVIEVTIYVTIKLDAMMSLFVMQPSPVLQPHGEGRGPS